MDDQQSIHLVDLTDADAGADTSPIDAPAPPPQPDSQIDVLYENQRGWFVFGIPLFSSAALWNFKIDPAPWVDAKNRPSAVDITNAQVPDPSWTWDWKSWYVDMSRDVDEEGWQYSLIFRGASWHGNHPWFHSFVRRRRWLRKRIKVKLPPKNKEAVRERMFGDTFSVGTTLLRTNTPDPASLIGSSEQTSISDEVRDTVTLMRKLKRAAIDREKIVIINRFIVDGGEELFYLAEQIPFIMSMFVFQNSRRQLLSTLMDTIDAARQHREAHQSEGTPETDVESRRIDNLLKAVEAADAECKKLEYWSDIRRLTEEGNAGNAAAEDSGWDSGWRGIDGSGPSHPVR